MGDALVQIMNGIVWFALALLGHAALIALLDPGAWKYGFRPGPELLSTQWVPLTILMVQGMAVAWGLRRQLAELLHRFGCVRLVGLLGLWTLGTTVLSRSPTTYAFHLLLTAYAHIANLGNLILVVQSLPLARRRWALAVLTPPEGPGDHSSHWQLALPWAAACFVLVVSACLTWCVFDRVPHVPDSVAYYFQAKTYAARLPYLSSPPESELFQAFLLMDDGQKWFSVFPPGWPLVLALGMVLDLPWLVNPLLGAIGVLLAYTLVKELCSRRTADVMVLLLALSPTYLFVSASFMAHAFSIVCGLLSLLAIHYARLTAKIHWGAMAGLALGALFLTRPIEGVVLGLVGGAWALGCGAQRLTVANLAAATLGTVLVGGLFFVNNWMLTGRPLYDPIQLYFDQMFSPGSNTLGFGQNKGNFGWGNNIFEGHSLVEAAIHVNINLNLLDIEMTGWSFGSLLFVGLCLLWGWRQRSARLWVAVVVCTVLPTTLYWYSGADLGPRYWYQGLVPLVVLSVLGAWAACERFGIDPQRLVCFLTLASMLGTLYVVPWRGMNKYKDYRGVRGDMRRFAAQHTHECALVLIRSRLNPHTFEDWAPAVIWNSIPLEGGTIYAKEGEAGAVARLQERYPGRPIWVLAAPSLTGKGFEVIEQRQGQLVGAGASAVRMGECLSSVQAARTRATFSRISASLYPN